MRRSGSLLCGLCLIFALFVSSSRAFFWNGPGLLTGDSPNPTSCAACTIVVGLLEQYSDIHAQGIAKTVAEVCDWFPVALKTPCQNLVDKFGPLVINLIDQKVGADEACRRIKICDQWPQCQVFPKPSSSPRRSLSALQEEEVRLQKILTSSIGGTDPWDWIKEQLLRVFDSHEPLVDLDEDFFSTLDTFRGTSWRGADCNDEDAAVYPGRNVQAKRDPFVDYNCNGIKGINIRGESFKDLLCKGTAPRGLIALGDSATAHFRIPSSWMNASLIGKGTFDWLLWALENELDWPHLGSYTGHTTDQTGDVPGPVDSIYLRLRQTNRCNHRDFQNIGVNGARVGSMADGIKDSMNRNQLTDNPAVVFHALIGNDVCNGHDDLRWTQPTDFEASVLKTLNWLDTKLPSGSSVILIGLVDGRILWDTMHARTHPIGVTYEDVYSYLNCLSISPCRGWMNTNETIRDLTSERAAILSAIYPKIIQENTFKNFKMVYYPYDVAAVLKIWEAQGGQAWELIEPIDGFHPSQVSNNLFAKYFWEEVARDHPDIWGPVNPNNAAINALFGDQGGY
eukprot:ANDGO_02850.mRNA.1 hypothetical protein DICPUDRAFT_153563